MNFTYLLNKNFFYYSENIVKNLLKKIYRHFNFTYLIISFLLIANFLLVGIFKQHKNHGMYYNLKEFLKNKSEENSIVYDKSVYSCISQFILVLHKINSFSQLNHRDEEFLHREIHMHPFYRDLMVLAMKIKGFNGDKYGLSEGLLNFYPNNNSHEKRYTSEWITLYKSYEKINNDESMFFVPIEGCDQEKIQEIVGNV